MSALGGTALEAALAQGAIRVAHGDNHRLRGFGLSVRVAGTSLRWRLLFDIRVKARKEQ